MKTSTSGLDLLKKFEGYREHAYLDGGGVPTIGYGTTNGVKLGQTTTKGQAAQFLARDVAGAEHTINTAVKVPLTQHQFDALVCFVYNVGSGAFTGSTLLQLLNQGHFDQVPAQLMRWNKDDGHVVDGLTNRRRAEGALFAK